MGDGTVENEKMRRWGSMVMVFVALTGLSNSARIGVLQLLCTVTPLRQLEGRAELGKMPKVRW